MDELSSKAIQINDDFTCKIPKSVSAAALANLASGNISLYPTATALYGFSFPIFKKIYLKLNFYLLSGEE